MLVRREHWASLFPSSSSYMYLYFLGPIVIVVIVQKMFPFPLTSERPMYTNYKGVIGRQAILH
jgi:hypothetical protein